MNIYKMKLHQRFEFKIGEDIIIITRVPGGWLYRTDLCIEVFVPFSVDPNLPDGEIKCKDIS